MDDYTCISMRLWDLKIKSSTTRGYCLEGKKGNMLREGQPLILQSYIVAIAPIWNNYPVYRAELGNEESCFVICLIMAVLFSSKNQTKRPTKRCVLVAVQRAAVI